MPVNVAHHHRRARVAPITLLCSLAVTIPAAALPPCVGENCATSVLEEVVVTGRRAPGPVMDSSASISVVNADALARSAVLGLADALREVPGIQVTDAGQPGLKRIRIRGEESRRTAVLVDGQEITDHWEVGTPLSLHPAMVERIEVLRGSGSVLYGPRALSGVVNFITRKGGDQPIEAEFAGGYDSATRGHESFGSVYGTLAGTEYRLAAAAANHDDRDTPQGRIPDTGFDNSGIYAWAGREFGAHRLELGYDAYDAATKVFVEEDQRTLFPLVDFRIDVPRRDREKFALFYEWQEPLPALAAVRANLQHQDNARVFETFSETLLPGAVPIDTLRWIRSDAALEVDDGVLQLDWRPGSAHYLVSGLQLTEERVNQERHVDTVVNNGAPRPEDIHDEASIRTVALFASDDWDLTEVTRLSIGARQYWVDSALDETSRSGLSPSSQSDAQAIGSVGLTHFLDDDTVLRLSAAQGYVYPSLLQFATGAYAGSRFVNPNPELDPEHSWSVEGGLRLRRGAWVVDGGLFLSRAEDYIDHVFCQPTDGCLSTRDKRYVNIGESAAEGLEAYVAREDGDWRPYSSLTWMKRENRYENFRTEDSGTPALSGTLGLLWQPGAWRAWNAWLDLQLRGETSSKREEPSSAGIALLDEDDSWITLNISGGAAFGAGGRITLVLELENLADATYSTSAENLYAPERSARARLGYRL